MSNVRDMKNKKVSLTLTDGVERTLKYDLNALAELEERYGSVDAAFEAVDKGSIKAVRCVLWAGLVHEDANLTEQQVGSLIDTAYLQELMGSMETALKADLPEESTEGEASPN